MDIIEATREYETWLTRYIDLVPTDLKTKHDVMASAAFPFMRGTFYRWLQHWKSYAEDLAKAPQVLGVGDIHVENFGTWRDAEGRLVWGVNDFDEAFILPYTLDIVRLIASASMAINANKLSLTAFDAADAVVEGYTAQIARGGQPFVLAEQHAWLRPLALNSLRSPVHFWEKMDALPVYSGETPVGASVALEHLLPEKGLPYVLKTRVAGIGSLGHARFVALADHQGGKVAREAKALVPSSNAWIRGTSGSVEILYQAILDRSVRCIDPFVRLQAHWIVRRLAPDCSRIELASLPEVRDEAHLLKAMGQELANIHLGTPGAGAAISTDLAGRKRHWYKKTLDAMLAAIMVDFDTWKTTVHPAAKPAQA